MFMGTPALAAHILDRLVAAAGDRFRVVAVVTRPDRPRGRKLALEPSAVATVAEQHRIRTLKPAKIRTAEFFEEIKSFQPDLLVVAAYGRILPPAILAAPKIAPINVHASLLPRHRGAAPVEGAILAGDRETGVTIIRVTEKMDAGPMYLKRAIPIAPDDTQGTLKQKLAELGAAALLEAIDLLLKGKLTETPQDEALATYTTLIEKQHALIDWSASAELIERTVRAYDPWPVARTTLAGRELLIWRAAVEDSTAGGKPGEIASIAPAPVVNCGVGRLRLIEVQAPGRTRMGAAEFFRGRRIGPGVVLGT